MKLISRWNLRTSHPLTQEEFEQLCINARVLEQDGRGIKVLQLANGNIFKVFRLRRVLTIARLYSYARQFCRNADRLHDLSIPTVDVVQLFSFEESSDTGVLYKPLPGQTLRQLGASGMLNEGLMRQFGEFIARLHNSGVYFRSAHFGNIVLTPQAELGLIDIADLSIYAHGLTAWHRVRNFRHLQRLDADWASVSLAGRKAFIQSYFQHTTLSAGVQAWLLRKVRFLPS